MEPENLGEAKEKLHGYLKSVFLRDNGKEGADSDAENARTRLAFKLARVWRI